MKNLTKKLDWSKGNGLLPAIIQDSNDGTVLMLGYMNREALEKTLQSKEIWFYSRSKQRLWKKGESSGNILSLVELLTDCDNDTLLLKVQAVGPVCHTGALTCFGSQNTGDLLSDLYKRLLERQKTRDETSYTVSLLQKGIEAICDKVEEEAFEVIKAANQESDQRLSEEIVDLFYHVMVLMISRGLSLKNVYNVVVNRNKTLRN